MSQVIEIGGVKLDVDMRHATRIEEIAVGTAVRVLTKDYSGHKVSDGIVVGFEPFKLLPTILIATVDVGFSTASVKIVHYNSESKDVEIVVALEADFEATKTKAMAGFDTAILSKQRELATLTEQREYFLTNFKATWGAVASVDAEA